MFFLIDNIKDCLLNENAKVGCYQIIDYSLNRFKIYLYIKSENYYNLDLVIGFQFCRKIKRDYFACIFYKINFLT